MRKKLKECGGFTMVEMLCVVAILVMLCLLTNAGLSLAMESYRDIIAESETQLLLNDLSDAMADKLRYAVVTVKQSETPTVTTEKCTFSLDNVALLDDGEVKNVQTPVAVPVVYEEMVTDGKVRLGAGDLLPSGAYGTRMSDGSRRYVVETAVVTWDNGMTTVDSTDPANPVITYPNLNDLREGQTLTFHITLKVKDRWGAVSGEKKLTVRCLNPIKEEGE